MEKRSRKDDYRFAKVKSNKNFEEVILCVA